MCFRSHCTFLCVCARVRQRRWVLIFDLRFLQIIFVLGIILFAFYQAFSSIITRNVSIFYFFSFNSKYEKSELFVSSYSHAFDRVWFRSKIPGFFPSFSISKLRNPVSSTTFWKRYKIIENSNSHKIFSWVCFHKAESFAQLQKFVQIEWLVENTGTSFKHRYQSLQNIQVTKERSKMNNFHSFDLNISLRNLTSLDRGGSRLLFF